MATMVQDRELPGCIRVAAVFDVEDLKPVWFDQVDRPAAGRIFVKKINMVWTHHEGSAKIISFAVSAGDDNNYTLAFDTEELVWSLSLVESVPFP